jgi:integral membrane protein (TIGR01906 family)
MWGAGITLLFYLGIVLYIAVNFNALFVQFHQVFFEGGTWQFLWSDTLIRLFPLRFWQDAFIFIGGASLVEALVLGAGAWWGIKP